MALTNKQRAFVNAYLETFNATKAALKAGYSKRTAHSIGHENLRKPEIRAAVDAGLDAFAMPAREVLARLSEMARADMSDFLDDDRETLDLAKADRAARLGLIKSFKHHVGKETENISIELYDAQAALVQLGKYHKLFVERTEHTGADGAAMRFEVVWDDTDGGADTAS